MILGLSVGAFTLLHVAISLVAVGSGLIAVGGMFASRRLPVTTAFAIMQAVVLAIFVIIGIAALITFRPNEAI